MVTSCLKNSLYQLRREQSPIRRKYNKMIEKKQTVSLGA